VKIKVFFFEEIQWWRKKKKDQVKPTQSADKFVLTSAFLLRFTTKYESLLATAGEKKDAKAMLCDAKAMLCDAKAKLCDAKAMLCVSPPPRP